MWKAENGHGSRESAVSTPLLQRPLVFSVRMAMAMRGKKSASILPEPWPDLLCVCLGQVQSRQGRASKERKPALTMCRRQRAQSLFHLEQEHQPMALALVAMLAHQSGKVQIARSKRQANFLLRFTASASIGRFPAFLVKFPAAGAPQAEIWLLRPLQQQNFVLLVEAIEQGGNFVRH